MIFWCTADIKPPANWITFDFFIRTTVVCNAQNAVKQSTAALRYRSGNQAPGCTHCFWVLECAGGAWKRLPHIPRGSLHPSPPPRSKRQGKNHEQQSSANERSSRCRGQASQPLGNGFPGDSGTPARRTASGRRQDPNWLPEASPSWRTGLLISLWQWPNQNKSQRHVLVGGGPTDVCNLP